MATTSTGNPYQPGSFGPARQANNGLGIAGFILAIVGIFTCGLLNILSLPISLIALAWRPRGFAVAGAIISGLGLAFLGLVGWGIVAGFMGLKSIANEAGKTIQTHTVIAESKTDIENYRDQHGSLPDGIEGNKLVVVRKDGWGQVLRYELEGETYVIRSSGPDQTFDTSDDLTSKQTQVETNLEIEGGDGFGDGPVMIPSDSPNEITLPSQAENGAVEQTSDE